MSDNKPISIGSRIKSVAYALKGLRHLITNEPNVLIHLLATVAVVIAGIVKELDRVEWVAVVIAIGIVWIAEAFNTCIELLCDLYIGKQYNKTVGIIKDISAAAVLIASLASATIGVIILFF